MLAFVLLLSPSPPALAVLQPEPLRQVGGLAVARHHNVVVAWTCKSYDKIRQPVEGGYVQGQLSAALSCREKENSETAKSSCGILASEVQHQVSCATETFAAEPWLSGRADWTPTRVLSSSCEPAAN